MAAPALSAAPPTLPSPATNPPILISPAPRPATMVCSAVPNDRMKFAPWNHASIAAGAAASRISRFSARPPQR